MCYDGHAISRAYRQVTAQSHAAEPQLRDATTGDVVGLRIALPVGVRMLARAASVVNADGSDPVVVPNTQQGNAPSWSPDGERLLFTSDRSGNDSIYVVDVDGSNLRRLTDNGHHNDNAVWSPDGQRIAFSSDRDGQNDIFVMDGDGNYQQNLTRESHLWADIPGWSADGSRIIFHGSDRSESVLWPLQAERGAVIVVHAALLMAVLLGLLSTGARLSGALTLVGIAAGFALGFVLQSPWLALAVVLGGVGSDVLVWRLMRTRSLVGVGLCVPVALYGLPLLEESLLHSSDLPAGVAVLTVLIAAAAGGGIAHALLVRNVVPA